MEERYDRTLPFFCRQQVRKRTRKEKDMQEIRKISKKFVSSN